MVVPYQPEGSGEEMDTTGVAERWISQLTFLSV